MTKEEKKWVLDQIAATATVDAIMTVHIAEVLQIAGVISMSAFSDSLRQKLDDLDIDRSGFAYRRLERLQSALEEISRGSPLQFH